MTILRGIFIYTHPHNNDTRQTDNIVRPSRIPDHDPIEHLLGYKRIVAFSDKMLQNPSDDQKYRDIVIFNAVYFFICCIHIQQICKLSHRE